MAVNIFQNMFNFKLVTLFPLLFLYTCVNNKAIKFISNNLVKTHEIKKYQKHRVQLFFALKSKTMMMIFLNGNKLLL